MTDLQSFTLMMASAQVVETSVNTNNSPYQDYITNPDDHSNHNIDSPRFKTFTVTDILEAKKIVRAKVQNICNCVLGGKNQKDTRLLFN